MTTKAYVLVTTRPSMVRAKKIKDNLEAHGMVTSQIVPKGNLYEVWAKPSMMGKIYVGDLKSKGFALYLRMEQYGKDGEVL